MIYLHLEKTYRRGFQHGFETAIGNMDYIPTSKEVAAWRFDIPNVYSYKLMKAVFAQKPPGFNQQSGLRSVIDRHNAETPHVLFHTKKATLKWYNEAINETRTYLADLEKQKAKCVETFERHGA